MLAAFDWTPWIAGYAALVATGGLVWQVYSWRSGHATQIVVESSWGYVPSMDRKRLAMITVYNRSAHEVRIEGAGWILDGKRSTSLPIISRPVGTDIPGPLAARSQGKVWLPVDGLVETLREYGSPEGTKLRTYADDGAGKRHFAKKTIDVNR